MANTRTSFEIKQYYYDATTPAAVTAAKITAGTEDSWTSTASTQNAYLAFRVASAGSLVERMRITSTGNVGIGTTTPLHKLSVAGSASVQHQLTVGGESSMGSQEMKVHSTNSSALVDVKAATNATLLVSAGGDGQAQLAIVTAQAGTDSKLVLEQGTQKFEMIHRGSSNSFVLGDGQNDLMTVNQSSGHTAVRGDLTVGGASGARKLTVVSSDSDATLHVKASGSGAASMMVQAASGASAKTVLRSGSSGIELESNGDKNQFQVTNGVSELLTINQTSGDLWIKGSVGVC